MDAMLLVLLVLASLLHHIYPLHDGSHPLVVDYDEHYYYTTLKAKMTESLSISNCSITGDVSLKSPQHQRSSSSLSSSSSSSIASGGDELTVRLVRPPEYVISKWGPDSYAKKSTGRIFAQVSPNLCKAAKFTAVLKGQYKRAKGCYKVYAVDKRTGQRVKRFNDYGATLHPEHVRCDNSYVSAVCHSSGHNSGMQVIDAKLREMNQFPFLVTAKRAIVGKGGMFALPCGPFGLFASCEAVKWGVPFANASVHEVQSCRDAYSSSVSSSDSFSSNSGSSITTSSGSDSCPYRHYKRVFVMTQYDDTQIGQFMQEALPKLIYHLDFLYANPDVFIHFGFSKRKQLPDFVLPHWFFIRFGLQHRLINGTVFAEEVFMPREGGCQDIGYNAWEVVTMRERFLQLSGIKETNQFVVKPNIRSTATTAATAAVDSRPTVLIVSRSAGAFTQNKADNVRRSWPRQLFPDPMLRIFQENFPQHRIEVFSDRNSTLMTSPLLQAQYFHRADVVVAMHGAGLSNAMFMRPGAVVVEVVYDFDARHAPVIGIFPRLSSIIGLHHYTVYIRDVGIDLTQLANDSALFARNVRLWA